MGDAGPEIITLEQPFNPQPRPVHARLNVGVVGIGRMGRRHALNILRQAPRATLLCTCSPAEQDLVWADEHLKPYGVQIFATFAQMIQTPGLEAVIIASATEFHLEHTIAALDRGI